ncbi:MAG: ZPR1-type zinc finger protein [Desulfurococcales archaeon]|nr:ZPR1-type zinc finger protein [Desulfurococcales archaeon]
MPRKKKDPYVCPRCGTRVTEPVKTWTLVSPMPDKYGRITITIMGSFVCPNCGYKWRAVIKKLKEGGHPPAERADEEKEEGEIIEIDLSDLDNLGEYEEEE